MTHATVTTRPLLDLDVVYQELTEEERESIVKAWIGLYVSIDAENAVPPMLGTVNWDNVSAQLWKKINCALEGSETLAVAVKDAEGEPDYPVPDLNQIGIPMCIRCGCTDDCACEGGCSWIKPGLCSACVTPAEAAEAPAASSASVRSTTL